MLFRSKAGESQVPNQPPYDKKQGSLAYARALELKNELSNELSEYKDILDFGEKPEIVIGDTKWDPSLGKDYSKYKEEQFVDAVIQPYGEKTEEKPFCKGGTLFREQRYYPGYSPMLGNNWKVDVEKHPNFGKTPPTMTNELVLVCKDQSVERRFYFPLESDFQDFKRLAPQGKFDNTLYNYQNNTASFPDEDFYSTLKLVGTSGQNVTDLEDNGIKKYWYRYQSLRFASW